MKLKMSFNNERCSRKHKQMNNNIEDTENTRENEKNISELIIFWECNYFGL